LLAAIKKKWINHPGSAAHQFNRHKGTILLGGQLVTTDLPNLKFVKGKKEVIYFCDGGINNTPEDRGSYNYNKNHVLNDVVPWLVWGNSSTVYGNTGSDSTTYEQRRNAYILSDGDEGVRIIRKLGLFGTIQ
jgi:hypothetical protein